MNPCIRFLTLVVGSIILLANVSLLFADEEFSKLFDGSTLKGWRGDKAHWSVVDGAIVGSTKPNGRKTNTFLIADGDYKDFVLRVKFKLTDGASGVQFRSRALDSSKPLGTDGDFRITGYQADIGGGDTGTFYEEKGRSTLAKADAEVINRHLKKDDWNAYEIHAVGDNVEVKINGHTTARYTEKEPESKVPRSGLVALQLQAGPGMEIAFKAIEIKKVDPKG